MSMEYILYADLEFRDRAAIEAAESELESEGYASCEDNVLMAQDLVWTGTRLRIAMNGSMPYACFDIVQGVLAIYASHAAKGVAYAINTEDGVGERFGAGESESRELEEDEVASLEAELESLIAAVS